MLKLFYFLNYVVNRLKIVVFIHFTIKKLNLMEVYLIKFLQKLNLRTRESYFRTTVEGTKPVKSPPLRITSLTIEELI